VSLPTARREGLTIRELPKEVLVYDRRANKAHCLNAVTALVWRHCDGRTDAATLAGLVRRELGVEQPEAAIGLALEQLGRRGLLEEPAAARLAGRCWPGPTR
jgi:hypothetical protein